MRGLDSSVPLFHTRVRGTRIVVTTELVSDVLRVLREEHLDYPGCKRLRTVSKDEMIFAFCERPANQGDCQFTPCSTFAKGPRFMNMVMTLVLHPLSHYNSITESRARFLLSLLEHLSIDFSSHFILSIIDVYKDTTTRDKLIFPLAITWILCNFSVPFPSSDHFSVMCAINYTTVNQSEAQFRSRRSGVATPPTPSAPSTSAPFTLAGGVTLDAIMAQLQRMDACLDILFIELYQVNTCVGRIARQQAYLGGFVESPSPPPEALEAFEDDDDFDDDDDGKMEMLALPALMRCLLDTLTLSHS